MESTPSPRRGAPHYALLGFGLLGPAGLWAMGRWTDPESGGLGTHQQLGLEPCSFEAYLDVPCPGCGVTTSVAHFADGAPLASLATQPLGTLLGLLALAAPLFVLARHLQGADLERDRVQAPWRWILAGSAAVVLGSWVYKLAIH
ncbi:MAG: DUF2752 domain-containing protein [Planctomycetota bacterium]|nr:DUF2752 domain-containing protein [Planctomycetota bacterium]